MIIDFDTLLFTDDGLKSVLVPDMMNLEKSLRDRGSLGVRVEQWIALMNDAESARQAISNRIGSLIA